jgi:hypothetical protein
MLRHLLSFAAFAGILATAWLHAQPSTRGVGIYPGDPREDFAPSLVPDVAAYRNLALRRPAFHSSSYDYNLTAQLVTDGIKNASLPRWVSVSTSAGIARKNERDYLLDHNNITTVSLTGSRVWIQIELAGGDAPLEVDRLDLWAQVTVGARQPEKWSMVVSGSGDGQSWKELGRTEGPDRPAREFKPSVALAPAAHARFYRVELDAPSVSRWNVGELALSNKGLRVEAGGPYSFTSAWKSAGAGVEWIYVDLGAVCTFDRVGLTWIWRAAEAEIQASDDAKTWHTIQAIAPSTSLVDDVKLAQPEHARYVRLLMSRPASPRGYILSEMEVFGRGGPVAHPKPAPAADTNGNLPLSGGGWRVARDSEVTASGTELSQPGFADQGWLVATVPATTLSSYWNAGALPDPNFGDNQMMISDSFFYADFWYRDEFVAPRLAPGRHAWLNFNGINWKAEVFCNGQPLGRIDGGFIRGRFDVTSLLKPGSNAIAVLVRKNATPGSVHEKTAESPDKNGGALGADNPTYHASVGWDWIPTIRGRNTGIWSDVSLTTSGPVSIENPYATSTLPLPNTSSADIALEATLRNVTAGAVAGVLRGRFGTIEFSIPVTVEAGASKTVRLDPSNTPALRLDHPKLWWPAGYGAPDLYPVELRFETAGARVSDETRFQAGVRQFTYSEDSGALRIWVNGRRFIPRGGNWGFPESMLRYRAREYDAAVRYHQDMHFTMIRNWVGQTGDDAFFDACDRHGIVVWQDFWLANPADGPNPDDPDMFLRNARDFIQRIRSHASLGLYCGRNEGYPPKPIEDGLRQLLAALHPGIHYIPSSADDVVSGHGPYRAQAVKQYFAQRATPKFHSEMGMPNIPTLASVKQMMAEPDQWPQAAVWGIHDFSSNGAQGGASFRDIVKNGYGGADNLADWVELAQFVNYDGYRAMFEAQSKYRMGLLIWMSHPTWPSFVWQTYDYYFDPSAAYFGSKKASEPLHIQWNPVTDRVEVVNYSAGTVRGLTAKVEILTMDGVVKWEKSAPLDSAEDSTESPIAVEYPAGLTPVHFVRLKLSRPGEVVSENFYMRGAEEGNFKAIRDLPKVKVESSTRVALQAGRWVLTTELHNTSDKPALMVRVKAVREQSGDRILPAIYSDNYVALMPGERRTIRTELANADTRGERPTAVVEGFNVAESR